MKVMVIVKATKDSEAGIMPDESLLAAMGNYNEELVNAGIMLSGEGLHPSSKGYRIKFSGEDRTVTDGPFTETKELIAGFWMWKVGSMQDAIDWVKRCPNPMPGESEIEIRQVFDADDFGDAMTPELRLQEARIRAKSLGLNLSGIEERSALSLAGMSGKYDAESKSQIPALWQKFAPSIGNVPGQAAPACYGVCYNFSENCGFVYLCGVEVNGTGKLPAELETLQVPAQKYAIFQHSQHVSEISKAFQSIHQWLPDSGYQAAPGGWIERYGEGFDPTTGLGDMQLWVPIQ